MRTYVYCLLTAPADGPPAGLRGLDDAPVRRLPCGAVDAWVSDVAGAPREVRLAAPDPAGAAEVPNVDRLVRRARAHDHVVGAALALGVTPLPARFGQTYASDAACAASVGARAAAHARALARVAGMVEMTAIVPLLDAAPSAPPASSTVAPGRAYLDEVRRRMAPEMHYTQSAVRRRITETVGALVRDEAVAVNPSPPAVLLSPSLRFSHLLPRAAVDDYRQALARISGELFAGAEPGLAIRVLGPTAPYTFAAMEGA
ncbi:MAG: GvpL/GvpF family gas vesicle protein [Gemmatimonadaceae bacterium]